MFIFCVYVMFLKSLRGKFLLKSEELKEFLNYINMG